MSCIKIFHHIYLILSWWNLTFSYIMNSIPIFWSLKQDYISTVYAILSNMFYFKLNTIRLRAQIWGFNKKTHAWPKVQFIWAMIWPIWIKTVMVFSAIINTQTCLVPEFIFIISSWIKSDSDKTREKKDFITLWYLHYFTHR